MTKLRRAIVPLAALLIIASIHFVWNGLFPERDPAQSRWVAVATERSWLETYLDGQAYFLGYSYGLSAAFAVGAFRRWRERGQGGAGTLAIGSVGASGIFSVLGCWLLGCCGSPMLGVYLSVFGAGFLPFAKPVVAAITTVSVAGAWFWLVRRGRDETACTDTACACGPDPQPVKMVSLGRRGPGPPPSVDGSSAGAR